MDNYYNLLTFVPLDLTLTSALEYLNNLITIPTHSNIYNFDSTNYELILYIEYLYGENQECADLLKKVKNFLIENYLLRKKLENKF